MPVDIRNLLHDSAPTESVTPLDTGRLWRQAKVRRHRRRIAGGLGSLALIGVIAGVMVSLTLPGRGDRQIDVTSSQAQLDGSPGMPSRFVATDFDNGVYIVDSHSGAVITTLLAGSGHPIDSVATGRSWVYLAVYGPTPVVERIPATGGPAQIVYSANAFDLALSPDGTQLAWANANGPGSTFGAAPNHPNVVTVYNLNNHTAVNWPLDQVPHGTFVGYGIVGITWTTNNSVAVLSSSFDAENNAKPGGGCSGSSANEICTPAPNPAFDSYLSTIDFTGKGLSTHSVGFNMPPVVHPPKDGATGAQMFANGDGSGIFVVAARNTTAQPVSTYRLTLEAGTVHTQLIQTFAMTQVPVAIDSDNRDTLIINFTTGGRGSEVQRSTDNGRPVVLNTTRFWATATW